MSLVTTPSRASPLSAPQSAAIRLLLPEPTGPPTPIRSARSTGKESLPLFEVDGGGELDRDRGRRRQRPVVGGDRARAAARHRRRQLGEPARGHGRVERRAASARRTRRSPRRRRAPAARCPRRTTPAAAATTPSAIGRGVSRDAIRYAAIGSPGQTVAAERSSCAPSRRAAVAQHRARAARRPLGVEPRQLAHAQRARRGAPRRRSGRRPRATRRWRARMNAGTSVQAVGDRLLEPERVGVGARREARVGEQERERVHG